MTAKEYLNQGFRINEYIDAKIEQIAMLRELAKKTSVTISDMPGSPNHDNSKVEEIIIKIVSLEDEINRYIDKLVDLKKEIMEVIDNVEDPQECLLLNLRYLNFLTWEQIAEKMDCSVRNVHIVHSKALENVVVPE